MARPNEPDCAVCVPKSTIRCKLYPISQDIITVYTAFDWLIANLVLRESTETAGIANNCNSYEKILDCCSASH